MRQDGVIDAGPEGFGEAEGEDREDQAAEAYDKMMIWCELHNTAGVKGGITNYDGSKYKEELPWLRSISQVCALSIS